MMPCNELRVVKDLFQKQFLVFLLVWELLNHSLSHWLSTWGKDPVSPGSTSEGNAAVGQEGVEPGCTSPRPHLRAECHWGRISDWRFLLCGVFPGRWGLQRWVSTFTVSLKYHPVCVGSVAVTLLYCPFTTLIFPTNGSNKWAGVLPLGRSAVERI